MESNGTTEWVLIYMANTEHWTASMHYNEYNDSSRKNPWDATRLNITCPILAIYMLLNFIFSWRNSLLLADKNAPVHCLVPILFHDVSFVLYAPSQTKIWRSTNLSLPAKIYEKTVVLVEGRMNERRHMATFTCLSQSVCLSVSQWHSETQRRAHQQQQQQQIICGLTQLDQL